MRLIDADALLLQIGIDAKAIGPGQYGDEWRFMGTINNAPTIEPTVIATIQLDAEEVAEIVLERLNPCNDCQEWDCYGCKYKETERDG